MGSKYPFYTHPFPRSNTGHDPIVLENMHMRAEFDPSTGGLRSLVSKKTGQERLAAGKTAGLVLAWAEKATNDAWQIGRILGYEPVTRTTHLQPFTYSDTGSGMQLRAGLEIEQKWLRSNVKTTISLDKDATALSYSFSITWNEAAADYQNVPVLTFSLPLLAEPEGYLSDVPAGAVLRVGQRQDVPGLQYTAAVYGKKALAIITDCKYGYRGCDGALSATLINTAGSPDPFPERGEHTVRLWVACTGSGAKQLNETAFDHCHNMSIVSGVYGSQTKALPPSMALLELSDDSSVLSSVGLEEFGGENSDKNMALLIRLYETEGKHDTVRIALPPPLKIESAEPVDLAGRRKEDIAIKLDQVVNSISFEIAPYCIAGIRLQLASLK
jgi:alpha-mannosidase